MNLPTIKENQLEKYIEQNAGPLVIDIWMDDCPPCNMVEPKLKATAQDYQDTIDVRKVKVTEDSPLMEHFDIEAVPALLFYKNSLEVNRLEGLIHSHELEEAFEELVKQ